MARIVAKLILVQFPCPTMCSVSPRAGSSRAAPELPFSNPTVAEPEPHALK
jgi:hypothetical protein